MMQIVLEKVHGTHFLQYLTGDFLMVGQNLVQCVGREVVAALLVQELTEGEATQIVNLGDAVQFGIFFFQSHHGRTAEDYFQFRI